MNCVTTVFPFYLITETLCFFTLLLVYSVIRHARSGGARREGRSNAGIQGGKSNRMCVIPFLLFFLSVFLLYGEELSVPEKSCSAFETFRLFAGSPLWRQGAEGMPALGDWGSLPQTALSGGCL